MTNPNIQTESRPKLRAKSANLEHNLQAQCVTWYGQQFPHRIKFLIGYFAETMNIRDAGVKTALGLRAGVSDVLFVDEYGRLIGIEMKHLGTDHSVEHLREQCGWLASVPYIGRFCDSLDSFREIILTGDGGISPLVVLKNLESVTTKTVLWDKVRG